MSTVRKQLVSSIVGENERSTIPRPGVTHFPSASTVVKFFVSSIVLAGMSPMAFTIPWSKSMSPLYETVPFSCPVQIHAFRIKVAFVPGSKRSDLSRPRKLEAGPGGVRNAAHRPRISCCC
jgi:hypothetical protein